jgi:flagellar biosynthetic protein FliR
MNFAIGTSSLLALLLVSARIVAWSFIAPPLATAGLPKTIKTVISVGLALVIVPSAKAHVPAVEVAPILGAVVVQVVIGAGLGFLTRMVFTAVEAAGSFIDLFGGFSLSAAYDPLTTTMTSVFGRFYAMLCTTLIFATDIHLVIFRGFLQTFTAIPLDAGFSLDRLGQMLTKGITELFVDALQIAGPLIVVLFVADIALGVLNRIAPQLNAFSLSFPLKIGLTLLLVGLGFMLLPQTVVDLADRASMAIRTVTG